jgi:hypothetical protein
MRPCDTEQLTLKPFAGDNHALVVGEDRVPREMVLGGAGRFESQPALTLFVSATAKLPVGAHLTVNVLSGRPRADERVHYEDSQHVRAPRIAESRLAFEGIVMATGSLEDDQEKAGIMVVRVLRTHQRWPRGCAIT